MNYMYIIIQLLYTLYTLRKVTVNEVMALC